MTWVSMCLAGPRGDFRGRPGRSKGEVRFAGRCGDLKKGENN